MLIFGGLIVGYKNKVALTAVPDIKIATVFPSVGGFFP